MADVTTKLFIPIPLNDARQKWFDDYFVALNPHPEIDGIIASNGVHTREDVIDGITIAYQNHGRGDAAVYCCKLSAHAATCVPLLAEMLRIMLKDTQSRGMVIGFAYSDVVEDEDFEEDFPHPYGGGAVVVTEDAVWRIDAIDWLKDEISAQEAWRKARQAGG